MVYMNRITQDIIEEVATLARLALTDDEKQQYAEQLSAVFDYFSMLEEVDTSRVEETCQVTGLEDVVRVDEVSECDEETRKKLIASFPAKTGNVLEVDAVFD